MRRRRRIFSTESLEPRVLLAAFDVREVAKFLPDRGPETMSSNFGERVAIDGNTAVVLAPDAASSLSQSRSGVAYVFRLNEHGNADPADDTWDHAATLSSTEITPNESFGMSVAIQGATIAVFCSVAINRSQGTQTYDNTSQRCLIFVEPTGGWQGEIRESAQLLPPEQSPSSVQHASIAIDANSIVIGGSGSVELSGGFERGFVFVKPTNGWSGTLRPTATLVAPRRADYTPGMLEWSPSVAASNGTIVINLVAEDRHATGSDVPFARTVYVYEKPVAGWTGYISPVTTLADPIRNESRRGLEQLPVAEANVALSGLAIGSGFIAIGLPEYDSSLRNTGAVAILTKPAGGWGSGTPLKSLLVSSQPRADRFLGRFIAVDGDTVVATGVDPWNPINGAETLVFGKPAAGWRMQQTENIRLAELSSPDNISYRSSMAFKGDFLVVGVNGVDGDVPESGAVSIFRKPTSGWSSMLASPMAPDWTIRQPDLRRELERSNVNFGDRVAIDGDYAAIATTQWDTSTAKQVGSIWVLRRTGPSWEQVAQLQPKSGGAFSQLGRSLAMQGSTIVAGGYDNNGESVIYVFERPSDGWAGVVYETANLSAPASVGIRWLGDSVAISGDTIIASGFPFLATEPQPLAVYVREGIHWTDQASPTALLRPRDPNASPYFGTSVSIDGDTIAVSSVLSSDGTQTLKQSAVYVFNRPTSGWHGNVSESARLVIPDIDTGSMSYFGRTAIGRLPIDVEGDVIAVAMTYPFEGQVVNNVRTAALVFDRTGLDWSGEVTATGNLVVSNGDLNAVWHFGGPIVISDGKVLLADTGDLFVIPGLRWTGAIPSSGARLAQGVWADLSGEYVIQGDPYESIVAQYSGSATVYRISLASDFGDAPDSYGTRRTSGPDGGARHRTVGPMLGIQRDQEFDAPGVLDGTSDDTVIAGTTNIDDEDGVQIAGISAGMTTPVTVTISGGSGRLYGWLDFNRDGDFADAGEQIFDGTQTLTAGTSNLQFQTPTNAVPGESYARFRLSSDFGLSWSGFASDGEVEDYRVQIQDRIPVVLRPLPLEVSNRPIIEWKPIEGITDFEIWLLHIPTNSALLKNTRVRGTTYQPTTALPIGSYSVWVRSVAADGSVSNWSQQKQFRVTTPVSLLPAPERHSINPTFRWDRLPGAVNYDLWLTNLTSGQRVLLKEGIAGTLTSYSPEMTLTTGQYRYWVRGRDAAGIAADWSVGQTFDIGIRVLQTEISTFEGSPTLSWVPDPEADAYEIYVSRSGVLIENSFVTSTSWKSNTILPANTYRFWVRGRLRSNGQIAPWSAAVEFKTGGQTVLQTALGAETSRPVLNWRPVTLAKSYRLQIVNQSNSAVVLDRQGIIQPQYSVPAILPDANYRVWARAESTSGQQGVWSPPLDFSVNTTNSKATVTQFLPRWVAEGVPLFQWQGSSSAVSFDYYLTNGSKVFSADAIATTSFIPSTPLEQGDWTMWVRARDAGGQTGAWSLPEAVTVGTAPSLAIVRNPNGSIAEVRWLSIYAAAKYEVYIQNLVSNSVTRISGVTLRNYSPAGSLAVGKYRVWVRAIMQNGVSGPWSQSADFVVVSRNDNSDPASDDSKVRLQDVPMLFDVFGDSNEQLLSRQISHSPYRDVKLRIASSDVVDLQDQGNIQHSDFKVCESETLSPPFLPLERPEVLLDEFIEQFARSGFASDL